MTRIKVYKNSFSQVLLFIVFGGLFTVFGISFLIEAFSNGFNTNFRNGDWNSVLFSLLGITFIIRGAENLYFRNYYIEWDDTELKLLLPDTRKLETIILSEINNVNIGFFKIELTLKDRTRLIDLRKLRYKNLIKVRDKFEEIGGSMREDNLKEKGESRKSGKAY
jgi:hypothetical protein